MSKYKISVILATYNVEKFINEAFNSLKSQTIGFNNLEIIFVDDVSTDSSMSIIDEWAKQYENVSAVFLEKNSGYCGKPRNVGMEYATAPYIMFLDPDDLYTNDSCEVLYNEAEKYNCDIVGGYYTSIDYDGAEIENSATFTAYDDFFIESLKDKPEVLEMTVGFWSRIYRTELLKENNIKFNETIPGQDQIASVECFAKAKGFAYIKKCIIKYRIRNKEDKSISFNVTPKYIIGVGKAYEIMYNTLKKYGYKEHFSKIIEHFAAYFINAIIDSTKISETILPECLESLSFTLKKCCECSFFSNVEYVKNISEFIATDNYSGAIKLINSIRPLRKYLIELENGKNWLESQYNNLIDVQEKWDEFKIQNNGLLSQNNGLINQNNYLIVKNSDLAEKFRALSVEHEWLKEKIHGSFLCRLVRKTKGWYKNK